MQRSRPWMLGLMVAAMIGAAPATPSYHAVEARIAKIRDAWAQPAYKHSPDEPGWNAVFDAIRSDLAAYSAAKTENERLRALRSLWKISASLETNRWVAAQEIREELRAWLRPRVTLAWASRKLVDRVEALPPTTDEETKKNRDTWLKVVDQDLGAALRAYEGATEVRARREALGKLHQSLDFLSRRNQQSGWGPSLELQAAVDDLYNGPNIQATADPASISGRLANMVVESGPVYRKGQTSYVTAGPYLGFGLMACEDGIMFYNRQMMSSVTPIRGFQQQVASDPQGRRATKLYHFDATSTDSGVVTVIAVLKPTGLQLYPDATHNVNAGIGASPQPGAGLQRAIASLIGLNRRKIVQKVYEGAIGQIRAQVDQESREEAAERSAVRAAQTNAQLRNVFLGPDKLAVKNFMIDGLKLRSRPEFVIVDGRLTWNGATDQIGAELPKPTKFLVANQGVSADVHLASVATNMARGYLQVEPAKSVTNLQIVTRNVPEGASPKDGVTVTKNTSFPDFAKAVSDSAAANDPKVMAVRVKKPTKMPEFTVDRNGFLIAIVKDFSIEVPAPPALAKGGLAGPAAKIYRVEAPDAEFAISLQIVTATPTSPVRVKGRIEGFDAGPGARVFAITDDDTKATPLSALSGRLILAGFAAKLKGQPIDVPLADLNLPGFTLASVSEVDPSGWMRVVLTPNGN